MPALMQELEWWTPGNAIQLPQALRHLSNALTESHFIDGIITQLFYNKGTVGNLAVPSIPTNNIPTPYLRSLDALMQANALRAVVETAASMIVRDPDFKVQTTGATWQIQRSARKLSQFVTAVGRKNKLSETAHQTFLDGCTNRVGGAKVFVENNKIVIERVRPDSIIYADYEGPYSKTLGQRHGIPRSRLRAMWPKDAQGQPVTDERARNLPSYEPNPIYLVNWINPWVNVDLVEVFEGWRCPQGEGDKGRHVVVSGDVILVDEEWSFDFPGILLYRWTGSYAGLGGTPLGEQLIPYQLQLQKMDRTITESISQLAIGRVWLQKMGATMSAPVTPPMTDKPAGVHYYTGSQPPIIAPGVAIGREYYDRRQLLREEMFSLAGVSVSIASGAKEAGLTTGIALREHNEQAYTRLQLQAQTLDRWFEQVAYAVIAVADKHFKKAGYRVAAPGTRLLNEIDWKDIDLGEMGEYEIQARTLRSLPNHPSARAEMLMDWVKLGQLDPKRVIKLMGARDLEAIEDRASIAEELAEQQISSAIDDCKFIAPEPYQGDALQILVEQGQLEYLKGIMGKAPAANLACLHRLVEQARQLMQAAAPAAPPMPPPGAPGLPPGPTMGAPMVPGPPGATGLPPMENAPPAGAPA